LPQAYSAKTDAMVQRFKVREEFGIPVVGLAARDWCNIRQLSALTLRLQQLNPPQRVAFLCGVGLT
jgi:hypothetical protein